MTKAADENHRWKQYIEDNFAQSRTSAAKISLAIQESPLKYDLSHGKKPAPDWAWTRTLHIPKFFDQQDKEIFEDLTGKFYEIFTKTIRAYKSDPKVRKIFRFSPLLNTLILHNPGYDIPIPMLRIDIFYNEKTKNWQVCEFNTDGTSAMFENDTMYQMLEKNNVWQALQPDAEYLDLMNPWIDAFLDVYENARGNRKPKIVITDILENSYFPELEAFQKSFEKRGLVCEVQDIRDLDYDGKYLNSTKTGTKYDAVYRRAVTKDVEHYYEDLIPFLAAIEMDAAVLIGDFQTQIIHSKRINEALFHPDLRAYFTEEENRFIDEHMPATFDLNEDAAKNILSDKDNWIIKPRDSYAARGVWAGIDVSDKLWKKLVRDFTDTDYIVQTYIHHYPTENIDLMDMSEMHTDKPHFQDYANLTGLYVYNGKFAGVYSRLADAGIISSQYNEKMVPTLFLKDKNEPE